MKILKIEFYLMHVLFNISRRHYCLGGSNGFGRIYTDCAHDRELVAKASKEILFPVRIGLAPFFPG